MIHTLPYDHTLLEFHLPRQWQAKIIAAPHTPAAPNPTELVEIALDTPIGSQRIQELEGIKSAAIAINDKTRPVPHDILLPALLQRLGTLGLAPKNIHLLIATGTHAPMGSSEFSIVVSDEIISKYLVSSHDSGESGQLAWVGKTSRETPVWVNRSFLEADLRIVVGNIEPHQFQGFSGGVKSAAIGLAGRETINSNHAMMVSPQARLGEYYQNPARQDIEEIGEMIGVHFALNAILNMDKQIVHVLAGNPKEVMQSGIHLSRQICQVGVDELYDLLIVSPGGYPKDINLYQSQKGLAHACQIIKDGGTVILAAACSEGTGSKSYESWTIGMHTHQQVIDRFQKDGFRIGPHKAFQISRDASRVKLLFLSEMDPEFVRSLLLEPIMDIEAGISTVISDLANTPPRVGIIPHANTTIPYLLPYA
jgi:nickel-dependent lactate racemase